MPFFSKQRELYEQGAGSPSSQFSVTIGTVVDTNDPQQMGRVRAVCPQWGDSFSSNIEDLPWAIYMAPFGGQVEVGTRGPGVQETSGAVSYGAWMIPKVKSQVVVMCVDGNPMTRLYIGCIYDQFSPHTLPHGRFMYDDHPELEKVGDDAAPYGPFSSSEKLIHPLAENQRQAFGNKSEPNHEFRSRAADYTATRVSVEDLSQTYSKVQDDKDVTHDDWISTQGYGENRQDQHNSSSYTDKNYDNMVYSITSPGFHSLSMDDRHENCRIRIRTTSGAQILIDDTNERIYISTSKGNNWIELDQDGEIDVFSTTNINLHGAKDVNITADETVRIHGKNGVHIHSDTEMRVHSVEDLHIKSDQSIRSHASLNTYMAADGGFHVKSAADINVQAGGTLNLRGGSSILQTAPVIHDNGPAAAPAQAPNEQPAYWTSRVPLHEPWARTMTKNDFTHDPEVDYTSKDVNKIARGRSIDRGMYWRR